MAEALDAIRPAATVIVLRDDPAGPQLLLVRRAAKLAFYGGAWVFPGGRVEAEDGDLEAALPEAARRAAVRELYEEAGLRVREDELVGFSRWLTPPGRSRRFDTFYFAVRAPSGEVRLQLEELDAHRWLTAREALEARERGELELPPPTFVTLDVLSAFRDVQHACEALAAKPLHYVPRPLSVEGGLLYLYPGDAGYETSDPSLPGARHRLHAIGPRWRYER
jgi:8-oxo-dGTP pyrophosphatase MutT (NUDIX family)